MALTDREQIRFDFYVNYFGEMSSDAARRHADVTYLNIDDPNHDDAVYEDWCREMLEFQDYAVLLDKK